MFDPSDDPSDDPSFFQRHFDASNATRVNAQDTRVTFAGHGYVEEVAWELPEVAGDEEDILNLGEVCIWGHQLDGCWMDVG